jgi:hypothetical protein
VRRRVEAHAVERPRHGADNVKDAAQGAPSRLDKEDRVQVDGGIARQRLDDDQFLDAAGDGADLDDLGFGNGEVEILDRWQVAQAQLVLSSRWIQVRALTVLCENNRFQNARNDRLIVRV